MFNTVNKYKLLFNYSQSNATAATVNILEVVWLCLFNINKKTGALQYFTITKKIGSTYNKCECNIKYLLYYKIYNFMN
jgi:hypothetical protein